MIVVVFPGTLIPDMFGLPIPVQAGPPFGYPGYAYPYFPGMAPGFEYGHPVRPGSSDPSELHPQVGLPRWY